MIITGLTSLQGAELDSHDDHRVTMAGIIAGLIADGPTVVKNIECIEKSYPDFIQDLRTIGANIDFDGKNSKEEI